MQLGAVLRPLPCWAGRGRQPRRSQFAATASFLAFDNVIG